MKKVPTIVLSVSYKGVKFIDATNKVRLPGEGWLSHNSLTELISPLVIMRDTAFLKLIFESLFISFSHFSN